MKKDKIKTVRKVVKKSVWYGAHWLVIFVTGSCLWQILIFVVK